MRLTSKQTDFAGGELATDLFGRTELEKYYSGASTFLNWQPRLQGGARRAHGTVYVDQLFGRTRLLSFEFSATTKYIFAVQELQIRIYDWTTLALHQVLVTPWLTAAIPQLSYAQALDTCVFAHEDYAPRRIYRDTGNVFRCEDLSDTTLSTKLTNIPADSGVPVWSSTLGWPRTCCFWEARLVFGGSKTYLNRVWLSKAGDYFNFDLGSALDDEAVDRSLLSDQHDAIEWLFPGDRLLAGTASGEWAVAQDTSITPGACNWRKQSNAGSAQAQPVSIGGAVVHITREGGQVQELTYTDVEQKYFGRLLSFLAPEAVSGAFELAVRPALEFGEPNLIYVVNTSGVLGILATQRDQDFLAWCRRSFTGTVEAVATIGSRTFLVVAYSYGLGVYEDDVYEDDVYEATGASSARFLVYVDADTYTDFTKTQTLLTEGLTFDGYIHLAGSTVQVLDATGNYIGDYVVSDAGVITLTEAKLSITAGVAIPTPTLTLMPFAYGDKGRDISMEYKRLVQALIYVQETRSLYAGGTLLPIRTTADDVEGPIPAYDGVLEYGQLGWDRQATFSLTVPDPLPATVLSVLRKVGMR